MPVLLHLDSSADLTTSRSRAITATFAEAWRSLGDDHTVVYRDLHHDALPYLSDAALHFPAHLRLADSSPDTAQEILQQRIIDELLGADVVLIGVPLYNYSMPATLKTWVDYIHVPAVSDCLIWPAGDSANEGSPRRADFHPWWFVRSRNTERI